MQRYKRFDRIDEDTLHLQVVQYVKLRYKKALIRTDYAAGLKMTKGQAGKQKALQGGRAWPDLQIAYPRVTHTLDSVAGFGFHDVLCGLYIELKAPDAELFMRSNGHTIRKGDYKVRVKGDWSCLHYEEQADILQQMRDLGYWADFAVGFDEAREIIDDYMTGKPLAVRYEIGQDVPKRSANAIQNMTPF